MDVLARQTSDANAYGKAVWSWPTAAEAKLRETWFRAAMGARKPGPQGARYKPRAGNAG
jgi:hypothetical protein